MYGSLSAYGVPSFVGNTRPGIMIVLVKRPRIVSRMFLSSFSDSCCLSEFRSVDSTPVDVEYWHNLQLDSRIDLHDIAMESPPSPFKQSTIFHINSSIMSSSQLSTGSTYAGQSNLANLIISIISCVVLITDGTKEFIIEEYKISYILNLSVVTRSQGDMLRKGSPMIDCLTCDTCNIYKGECVR